MVITRRATLAPAALLLAVAGSLATAGPGSAQGAMGRDCPPPPSAITSISLSITNGVLHEAPAQPREPLIQIAICLDTSGSMEGLLNQARTRLWDLVNFLSTAKKNGRTPRFEVALYQYGSSQLPSSEGYLRCVQPFTSDLDLVSERLFSLTINGSSEYCGQVMQSALGELNWSSVAADAPAARLPYRTLVIAGNEEFTQGPVGYEPVVKAAKDRGIFINTIYCGARSEGEGSGWLNAAYLNGGSYINIDQDQRQEYIPCPQDADLMRLNKELNATYLSYTADGKKNLARQQEQDSTNTAASREAGVQRTVSKSQSMYRNSSWDIVDALDENAVELDKIPTQDLPDVLKPMTIDQRKEHIARLRADRRRIQADILRLNAERETFLKEQRKNPRHGSTLDAALVKAIREQAEKLGFTFSPD